MNAIMIRYEVRLVKTIYDRNKALMKRKFGKVSRKNGFKYHIMLLEMTISLGKEGTNRHSQNVREVITKTPIIRVRFAKNIPNKYCIL